MRLTGTSLDCYQYLEPLYLDYRKLRRMNKMGSKLSSSCSILTLHWVPLTTILTTMSRFQNFCNKIIDGSVQNVPLRTSTHARQAVFIVYVFSL